MKKNRPTLNKKKLDHKDKILSKFTTGRTKAIKKRKTTLFLDYKLQHKSNKFRDRRIGENNSSMTADDRIMARFVAQRVKSHKKNKFNLGDEEETLTHQGRTLMDFEKFTDPIPDDSDDDDDGRLDANFVKESHFGGGLFTKVSDNSSHMSTIEKLIAESKIKKAERQQTKDETDNLTAKLDKDLQELFPLMSESSSRNAEEYKPIKESYDVMVRELKFEPVGKPSDKLKSEDEIRKEENERLQKLENERLERMKRTIETKQDEEEPLSKKYQSADDLDDGFDLDVFDDDDDDDDVDDNEEDNEGDEEEEQEENQQQREEGNFLVEKSSKKSSVSLIPQDLVSLNKMLGENDVETRIKLIEDAVKAQRVHTGISNVNSFMNFFKAILQYVDQLFLTNVNQNCWKFVDKLAPVLFELVQISPDTAGQIVFNTIKDKYCKFSANVKQGCSVDMLIFLKLLPIMFPTSDYHHCVATPAAVFLCHIISQNSCKNGQSIAMGLFSVTMMLEYTDLSNRFCPEAVNFLRCVLYIATPDTKDPIPPVNSKNKLLVLKKKAKNIEANKLRLSFASFTEVGEEELPEKTKLKLIFTCLKLLSVYIKQYRSIPSAFVLWSSVLEQLNKLPMNTYPSCFKEPVDALSSDIKALDRPLELLMAARKRPKALRLYEPNIREVIEGQSFKTVSQKKLEHEKLMHEYKKEMKGAIREIRKDRNFLARVKVSEQAKQDAERRAKVKQIFGWGQSQQSELKRMERKNRFRH